MRAILILNIPGLVLPAKMIKLSKYLKQYFIAKRKMCDNSERINKESRHQS